MADGNSDVPGGVMRISVPTLLLEGDVDPFAGAQRVVVHADTFRVRGRVRLPGRTISILARSVEAEEGILDFSGAEVGTNYDPAQPEPSLNGTAEELDGQDGASGERGHDGGSLTIHARQFTGQLTVIANGSAGGNGQRGGDGAQPNPGRPGNPGSFTRHWPAGTPEGPYGAQVISKSTYNSRIGREDVATFDDGCEIAFGEKGGDAREGGNGGRGGRAGDGGRGGAIQLRWVVTPAKLPQLIAQGAKAGEPGKSGTPGPPSLAGQGGRNRLYWYHNQRSWHLDESEKYADEDGARYIVKEHNIAPRASAGAPCDKYGSVPPAPESAAPGGTGTIDTGKIKAADLGLSFDPAYIESLRQWAKQDATRGEEAVLRALEEGEPSVWEEGMGLLGGAELGYSWLRELTRIARTKLFQEAEEQLAVLNRFKREHPFVL